MGTSNSDKGEREKEVIAPQLHILQSYVIFFLHKREEREQNPFQLLLTLSPLLNHSSMQGCSRICKLGHLHPLSARAINEPSICVISR